VVKYAQLLGLLMSESEGIAIAGTHGKSTTSALVSYVLREAGLDPSFVIGAGVDQLGGGSGVGSGSQFVVEACEYDRSFQNLRPRIATILNLEEDHLDYYRDLDEIEGAFRDFARLIPHEGFLATLNEHERIFRRPEIVCDVETFGLRGNADWIASDFQRTDGVTYFNVRYKGGYEGLFELRLAGLHNVLNCLGVLAVSRHLGLDFDDVVRPALLEYRGVDRRMQTKYEGHGVLVLDDYAHHPREVAAVLSTLREEFPGRRVVAVFQPHQASRTKTHLSEFAEALKFADRVFVPDIYLARDSEADRRSVHALDLVRKSANRGVDVTYVERLGDVAPLILSEIRVGDLVVTMGAGSVWEVSSDLADRLRAFDHQVIAP
jgi:UDP-N-acetylmuramate--alanine ligase